MVVADRRRLLYHAAQRHNDRIGRASAEGLFRAMLFPQQCAFQALAITNSSNNSVERLVAAHYDRVVVHCTAGGLTDDTLTMLTRDVQRELPGAYFVYFFSVLYAYALFSRYPVNTPTRALHRRNAILRSKTTDARAFGIEQLHQRALVNHRRKHSH